MMSKFTTPAVVELLGKYLFKLREPFDFYLSEDNSDIIEVPAGFISDLATVPRIFWTVLPPHGEYAKAAIIHDYLYDNALRTKREADLIFLDAMMVLKVPRWKQIAMFLGAHFIGKGSYSADKLTGGNYAV